MGKMLAARYLAHNRIEAVELDVATLDEGQALAAEFQKRELCATRPVASADGNPCLKRGTYASNGPARQQGPSRDSCIRG
jgi:hypothetical protein